MGLHYALITRIQENFSLPNCVTTSDAYLEVMCGYPPLTHALAASIGYLVGSPFLGMIFSTAASVFIIYAAILSMMKFEKDILSLYAAAAFCFVCLVFFRHTPMLGAEVRGNFFFSQVVGTAMVFAFIATQRAPRPVASVVFVFILGWAYPIAAIQLGCAAVASMILTRRRILPTFLLAVCAASAVIFHPLFQASVGIASHNGDIGTGYIPASWTTFIIFALTGSSAIIYWKRLSLQLPLQNPTALPAISAGVAAAAGLQWAAFTFFVKGSEYIVQKHLFVCVTLLTANIIIILFTFAHETIKPTRFQKKHIAPVIVSAAFFCCLTILPPFGGGRSVWEFVRAEKLARATPNTKSNLSNHQEQFALDVGVRRDPITPTAQRHFEEMHHSLSSNAK